MFDKLNKKPKGLSGVEKDAKESVLQELKKMAQEMMGDKLHGLKKVTVASNDEKGLKEGLAKAKELIGQSGSSDEMSMNDEDDGDEAADMLMGHDSNIPQMPSHGDDEDSESPEMEMTEEEIEQKLKDLMALKAQIKKA